VTRAGIAKRLQADGHLISGRRVGNFVIRSLCPTITLSGRGEHRRAPVRSSVMFGAK
jgi:hypothetical protein